MDTEDGKCPHCGANMKIALYTLDVTKVALVIEMSRVVRANLRKGIEFTISNQVHVPSLPTTDSVRHETTHCAKLGLINKVLGKNKKQVSGFWFITNRGFALLRGEPVPKKVAVWRGEIQERFIDEKITIAEAQQIHEDKIKAMALRNKDPKIDLRKIFVEYNPAEWIEYTGVHQGLDNNKQQQLL